MNQILKRFFGYTYFVTLFICALTAELSLAGAKALPKSRGELIVEKISDSIPSLKSRESFQNLYNEIIFLFSSTKADPVCPENTIDVVQRLIQEIDRHSLTVPTGQDLENFHLIYEMSKNIPKNPKCLDGGVWDHFLQFRSRFQEINPYWTSGDILHLFQRLNDFGGVYQSYLDAGQVFFDTFFFSKFPQQSLLTSNGTPQATLVDESDIPDLLFTTSGNHMYLTHKNLLVGRGGIKTVRGIIDLEFANGSITSIQPKVMFTIHHRHNDDNFNFVRRAIRAYRQTHATADDPIENLATHEKVNLNGIHYFIQEKFDTDLSGTTLLLRKSTNSLVLQQIALGLFHLHNMGLVHGDLKPENILVKFDPHRIIPKLVINDFDLTTDPRSYIISMTTPDIEAPEMMDTKAEYPERKTQDPVVIERIKKRDIFSFGILALMTMPKYKVHSLYKRCRIHYSSLDRTPAYNACIKTAAIKLHEEMNTLALNRCGGQTPLYCKEQIIADCLDPDPDLRPGITQLQLRLEGMINALDVD